MFKYVALKKIIIKKEAALKNEGGGDEKYLLFFFKLAFIIHTFSLPLSVSLWGGLIQPLSPVWLYLFLPAKGSSSWFDEIHNEPQTFSYNSWWI